MPIRQRSLGLAQVLFSLFVLALVTTACSSTRQAPRVTRLSDGLMLSPTATEAEAFCRNSGDPVRLMKPVAGETGVRFRCD